MNRSYINEVEFKGEEIKLRKPKKEKLPPIINRKRRGIKALFALFVTVTVIFVLNFFICTVLNGCGGNNYKTIIDCWQDYQKYEKQHSY
jgi:hypothetical protein